MYGCFGEEIGLDKGQNRFPAALDFGDREKEGLIKKLPIKLGLKTLSGSQFATCIALWHSHGRAKEIWSAGMTAEAGPFNKECYFAELYEAHSRGFFFCQPQAQHRVL